MKKPDNLHDVAYLYKAGAEAYAEGHVEKALNYIEQVLKKDPKHTMAWTLKGNCLDLSGKYEEALESYDTAFKLDPSDPDILFSKAETLEKMGREKDAKETMDKAVKLDLKE
ncbi:MAG: tetratricopeptide repeat protein [Methanomicrobiales archaeon]|nr:tetratricopeptide repeat protein [Methanomicrobiales archaeon]